MKKKTKYWEVVCRLYGLMSDKPKRFKKHETDFLKNAFYHADPYSLEEFTDAQKTWLLKLNEAHD